tara:strand:+ start:3124 stop:4941 length:1818 start_codon:yes stop_codon:yes gene_type:complete
MNVTILKNLYEKDKTYHRPLTEALTRIKEGNSAKPIGALRDGDKSQKNQLPAVLFSGEFRSRKDSDIIEHSGFIVLDFDHVGDVQRVKDAISIDSFVYSCWVSPSGDGIKALVRITNSERHKDHFRALESYFMQTYDLEVDSSGINVSRACFESYDPDLVLNEESTKFGGLLSEQAEKQELGGSDKIHTNYIKLNTAALMIRRASEGEKHIILLKAATLCGGWVATGQIEESDAVDVMYKEICKRDIDDEKEALSTIHRGIEAGRLMPIKDLIADENATKREMLINDGDMSFISSDTDDLDWIIKYANGDFETGLDTGDPELDKCFMYKREFVVINGHSNVGKTTTALYMMVNSATRHGWRWLVYSSENKTAALKMKLMQFACDRKIGSMNSIQRSKCWDWVNKHFLVISNKDAYTYSEIIVMMEKSMRQYKIDACFIDPYNSLRLDMRGSNLNSHEYHYEAATEFLQFSTNNNVAVWLNMHAVTEAQRRKGSDGLAIAPFAEDTEGGGKFVNRADCFLTIHRKVQSQDHNIRRMSELHVRKVREVETGGLPTGYDNPYILTMNSSMTGFHGWLSKESLFQPIDIQEDKPFELNYSLKPNEEFLQ